MTPPSRLRTEPLRRLAADVCDRLGRPDARVEIALVDDQESRRLNRDFLGRDRATNVLSFPGDGADDLGQLAVNLREAQRQSAATGFGLSYVLGYYIIHGLLHLAGFDHERAGPDAADLMTEAETRMSDLLDAWREPKDGR